MSNVNIRNYRLAALSKLHAAEVAGYISMPTIMSERQAEPFNAAIAQNCFLNISGYNWTC